MSYSIGVGLNFDESKAKATEESIKSTLDTIQKNMADIKIKIDLDNVAQERIGEITKQLQKVVKVADMLGDKKIIGEKQVDSKVNTTLTSLGKELENTQKKMGTLSDASKQQLRDLERLGEGYTKVERHVEKFNAKNKPVRETIKLMDDEGVNTRTVRVDHQRGTHDYEDTVNYEKQARLMAKANRERLKTEQQILLHKERANKYLQREVTSTRLTASEASKYNGELRRANSLSEIKDIRDRASLQVQERRNQKLREELQMQERIARQKVERTKEQAYGKIDPDAQFKLTENLNKMRSLANAEELPKNASTEMRKLNQEVNNQVTAIKDADQGWARLGSQIGSAIVRVPVYAATMLALYAPINALKDAFSQMIDIDTQMTVLERVSNGTIKTNEALEDSIDIAGRLGNVIEEVNDGLISFARQGYRGDDLSAITEVATVMGNVSDLTIDESASSLTAAMKGFKIEAQDSIRIVDALNEVDNNYAITTQQLAQSLERSAGTAATYGSELESVIGYSTAIGQVTRESGRVIGKQSCRLVG